MDQFCLTLIILKIYILSIDYLYTFLSQLHSFLLYQYNILYTKKNDFCIYISCFPILSISSHYFFLLKTSLNLPSFAYQFAVGIPQLNYSKGDFILKYSSLKQNGTPRLSGGFLYTRKITSKNLDVIFQALRISKKVFKFYFKKVLS